MGENERTVWDDLKNQGNVDLRGIDFADLDEAFDGRFSFTAKIDGETMASIASTCWS